MSRPQTTQTHDPRLNQMESHCPENKVQKPVFQTAAAQAVWSLIIKKIITLIGSVTSAPPAPFSPILAVSFSQSESLEKLWEEKNMPIAETMCLSSSLYERVKEAKARTAQRSAACSISSSWLLYVRQTAVAPDVSFSTSHSLRKAQQKDEYFWSVVLWDTQAEGRLPDSVQYYTREWDAPLIIICWGFLFLFFSIFSLTPICHHYLKLSDDLHCFKAL